MEKLKMHTPDLTQANINRIRELFPNCVTEVKDAQGAIKLAVDFDLLKQELSGQIVEGPQERYHLNWPGKREALLTANAPIAKTLRPCREESVNFDTTKNLFIEGDNLEALKLLQETYLGKIKMIYIDPPYNTGKDFIYDDDFAENTEEFLRRSNQKDDEGNRLVANTESNGRFHSDWLSMMYSRLKVARNFLTEDGVIFISIDDGECANLKKICDEIFGKNNFIESFVWNKKTAPNNVIVGSVHEYILLYAKDLQQTKLFLLPRDAEKDADYKNPDNDPRGRWKPDNLTAAAKGGRETPSLMYKITNPRTGREHLPPEGRMWAVPYSEMIKKIAEGSVYWGKDGDGRPMNKRFLNETRNGMVASTLLTDVGSNSSASKELQNLFGGSVVFETPKPVSLIWHIAQIALGRNDVFMDFYAGSCSSAEAIFRLNMSSQGNRRFILVQLPEGCLPDSAPYKLGFKNISEVGKERIRRAGKKIQEENLDFEGDIGFRVLKIATSNMEDLYCPRFADDWKQDDLLAAAKDYIKPDRTSEDLLFHVLLVWGVDLTLPIAREKLAGRQVYFVDGNALAACFDTGISEDFVKELAARKPLRVVFRDNGFASDAVKINVGQIFKQLSPATEVKSI